MQNRNRRSEEERALAVNQNPRWACCGYTACCVVRVVWLSELSFCRYTSNIVDTASWQTILMLHECGGIANALGTHDPFRVPTVC